MNRRTSLMIAVALLSATAVARAPVSSADAATCAPVGVTGGEWRTYGHDLSNTRHQDRERHIAHADVPFLRPAWTFSSVAAGGSGDFTGTPIVADGCVYVGSNGGWIFAMNADTGENVWAQQVPAGGAVNSTVAVAAGKVIATVSRPGSPYAVAFDQTTGAPAWTTAPLDSQPGSDSFSSPVVYDGMIVTGVSGSSAEVGQSEADRYAFQGSVVLLDVTTGAVVRKIWTIHAPDAPPDDYAGASVWSTPAIDVDAKVAYVGTGNPFNPKAEHAHANAVIKIDLDRTSPSFATILGSYHGTLDEYVPGFSDLPCEDIPGNPPPYYPQGIGSCGDIDLDFGAAPNLFTDASGRKLVGAGQKSGVYHAFDAATMAPAWSIALGPPSLAGGIVGSTAYDGNAIYGPVTPGGYQWSITSAGDPRWVTPTADGAHYANASAVANGIVYATDLKGALDAFDGRNGVPLLHYPMVAGSGIGANPPLSWGGVSVARNTIYATVGVSGLPNGFIVAFRPAGVGTPPPPPVGPVPLPGGVSATIVAGPGAQYTTYATPIMVVAAGGSLAFTNGDVMLHDVVARDKAQDGTPLFRSELVGLGGTSEIVGLEQLEAGHSYQFTCSIHNGMSGTLVAV